MGRNIEEEIAETRRKQAINIQDGTVSSSEVWDCRRLEHEGINDENRKEHVEECLGKMLNNYIEDDRNYALDGAVISCDQMSDKMVFVQFREDGSKISIEEGKEEITSNYKKPADIGPESYNSEGAEYFISSHIEDEYIRKLYAVHGSEQSANDIPFATVIDRTSLREAEETTGVDSALAEEGKAVSIIGCGNCGILNEKDIKKIAENWDSVRKYGTCYLFMKPDLRWSNPYCMESVVGECSEGDFLLSATDIVGCMAKKVTCTTEHHKTMRFSTKEGEQEGLTMMSTLLCTRGGIITIEAPGQIYIEPKAVDEEIGDIEERIEQLVKSVVGSSVNSSKELKGLSTMEILSRLIYQEQGTIKYQDSIIFSIVNRLFSNTNFTRRTNTNNIYSVITGLNQYESIEKDDKEYPNAFIPPNQNDSAANQASWENAKRLAAILCIAIEEYGEPNEHTGEKERDENVVRKGDEETYQKVIDFLEQQNLINEIEGRDSFYGTKKKDDYNIGGNLFYYK